MSPVIKSRVFRNLSKYVRAGMGIDKACESLLAQPGVPADERKIYQSIERGVRQGKTIAASMSASSRLDDLDYQMLDASEKGGRLDSGLDHLADYHDRVSRTRSRIRKGLAYPIFLFHFGLIATTFATAMFSRLRFDGEPKPWGEALWGAASWVIALYLLALILLVGLLILLKQARHSAAADRLISRIPLLGKTRRFAALERFSSVFEIFLLAGMKMDESLSGASSAANNGLIRASAKKTVPTVRGGDKLGPALLAHPAAFPNEFARGVTAGEEAGMLDIEFGRWKQFYGESLNEAMDQLAAWIPKIVYFGTLIIVAVMIVKVGFSYVEMLNGIIDM